MILDIAEASVFGDGNDAIEDLTELFLLALRTRR